MEPSSTINRSDAVARAAAFLEGIDRRWLYLAVFLGVLGALTFGSGVRVKETPPVTRMYERVQALTRSPGRFVLVAIDFDPQTKAENYPQAVATIRHLFRKRIPFAVVTTTPTGAGFCEEITTRLGREYRAEYGRDWVNWGYKYGGSIFVKALASDVLKAVEKDAHGTPLAEIEVMKGVTDATSVDLVCEFTGLVGALEMWLQFFQKAGKRPDVVHGCTAVSGPSNYAFLDSGQISGLLVGMLGAAEYEQRLEAPGGGLAGMAAQTIAHLLIILFIVVGNVAELIRRRGASGRREGGVS